MSGETNDTCIYYYHGYDWSDIPARQRYLMAAMAKYVPVVYFDGGTDRRLSVTFEHPQANVTVVRGLTAIGQRLNDRGLGRLAGALANWKLRKFRRKYRRVIFWTAENWLCPHRFIQHDALVYDCIDPSFNDDPARLECFRRREERMLSEADHVFATAESLAEGCAGHNAHVTLLNNACEPADYQQDQLDAAATPAWWPNTELPIAGYLGSLDWRFDFDAVEKAAREHVNLHFVLAGNQLGHLQDRVRKLAALPNVSCPGRISIEDGRFLMNRCTIGLIPFTAGEMNDAINPVKMYLYALLGKPMAGTAVRELLRRPEIVATASESRTFSGAVGAALERSRDPRTAARLREFAAENTWDARAAQAWEVIRGL